MIPIKELFIDALPIIQKFAPSLGNALGGPYGMATGYAVSVLANVFSGKPSELKELAASIFNDPSAPEKLGAIEDEHGQILMQLINNSHGLAKLELHVILEWQDQKQS